MTNDNKGNMQMPREQVLKALAFILAGRDCVLEAHRMQNNLMRVLEVDSQADIGDWVWETGIPRSPEYFIQEIERFLKDDDAESAE